MKVNNIHYQSIAACSSQEIVTIIDQTRLPHEFILCDLVTVEDAVLAIKDMWVRGAPLIGATAAYGLCLALKNDQSTRHLNRCAEYLLETRPTAVNLRWALDYMLEELLTLDEQDRKAAAWQCADKIWQQDIKTNEAIGEHGFKLINKQGSFKDPSEPINILTHCNAGWLATVDWGTALAPIYKAHDAGLNVHVWVDETRPRNQGAHLTAWELKAHGVPHHVIVDNAGGHLMQQGMVDLCIVGTDRTAANGDVCNKIGTYLKALAARDNNIPFYVALPSPTIDWQSYSGAKIPIENRSADEVRMVSGQDAHGQVLAVSIMPENTPVSNPAFDVTPAHLITGLITERGVCDASKEGLERLFPEQIQSRQ